MKEKNCLLMKQMRLFLTPKLDAIFDIAGRKTSSRFFSNERYWDLICVKAKNMWC